LRLKKFRQADDLRAFRRGLMQAVNRALQVLVRIGRRRHLDESYAELVWQILLLAKEIA